MLKNYFKVAWRNIVRHKIHAVLNVLGLSLGICGCLLIWLVTSFELSFDQFHPDKNRIFRVVTEIQSKSQGIIHIPFIPDPAEVAIRLGVSGLDQVSMFHPYTAKVTIPIGHGLIRHFDPPDEKLTVSPIIITDREYFNIFKYHWLDGNAATALNEPFQVVLSENEARKYFGKLPLDRIMGRTIIYNDSLLVTVSGIIRDWHKPTDFGFKEFISFPTVRQSFLKNGYGLNNWEGWNGSQTFVKLDLHTTAAQVNTQFPKIVNRNIKIGDDKLKFFLQPLTDIHFNQNFPQPFQANLRTLFGLMAIAAFILIIAVINFINLSTAQSIQRAKEIGIRKVLGSSRQSLVLQFLGETFLLTLFAVAIALLLIDPVISAFHSFIPPGVTLNLRDIPTDIFLLLLLMLTSLLAGFYPAKILSGYKPVISLKAHSSQQVNQKGYLRKALIVFQFTISIGFIIGTLIIGNQIRFMLNKDLGFAKDAIINLNINGNYPLGKAKLLAGQIKQIAAVQTVSLNQGPPADMDYYSSTDISYRGTDLETQVLLGDENYISLYQLKLLAGRNLLPSDSIRELLINATCAKRLGFAHPEDAIGKLVHLGFDNGPTEVKRPIAGVLADFHSQSLQYPITPVTLTEGGSRTISFRLQSSGMRMGQFNTLIGQIGKDWKAVYPNEKFEYRFFDDQIADFYNNYRKTSQIMDLAMVISILISCMGLFGLITFTTVQRTQEIGIRKVLGASVGNIVQILSRDFLSLVFIAIFIASPIAWYFMNTWLSGFAYHIRESGWIFVLAGLSALMIAFLTMSIQAIKAASANPVKSLRME